MFTQFKKTLTLVMAASLLVFGGSGGHPVDASSFVQITESQEDLRDYRTVPVEAKPADLNELRRKYSETFKFRGPEGKQIALTFDDGPDPRFTPQILDVLHRKGVKATFFVVGVRAKKFPGIMQRIHRDGHIIGNHSFSHPNFHNRSVKQFQNEIQRTEKIIQSTVGYRPKLIRPPYGEIKEEQLQWAQKNGYTLVNWNVDSQDWKGLDKEKVKSNVIRTAGPGSIILHHSGGGVGSNLNGTIQALPEIIDTLQAQGYRFVDLAELLQTNKYR
ncbi:polysaccharide deacetylase family protein [Paenibacillus phocaensis]|uniref:polysaccharide deacetylase family protein n=1 Tax=Paenibacillus phocaensis TaxID=1776378 RepID=UPI000AF5BB08|nr:polysaccharide deacetylase family protein [Paenibacillus phocaensis]